MSQEIVKIFKKRNEFEIDRITSKGVNVEIEPFDIQKYPDYLTISLTDNITSLKVFYTTHYQDRMAINFCYEKLLTLVNLRLQQVSKSLEKSEQSTLALPWERLKCLMASAKETLLKKWETL